MSIFFWQVLNRCVNRRRSTARQKDIYENILLTTTFAAAGQARRGYYQYCLQESDLRGISRRRPRRQLVACTHQRAYCRSRAASNMLHTRNFRTDMVGVQSQTSPLVQERAAMLGFYFWRSTVAESHWYQRRCMAWIQLSTSDELLSRRSLFP